MKQQIKLTESELYSIIKEAATNLIKEYGDRQETREKMAKAAKRSVEKGDDSTYHNAINSLHKRNSSKSEMSDFQKKFEEGDDFNEQPTNTIASESKKQTKITESQLFGIIRESVKSILGEAFKSPKLDAMARQHGGIDKRGYGYLNGYELPISELTDDMIGDETQVSGPYRNTDNAVNFKDGTFVPITDRNAALKLQQNFGANASATGRYDTLRDGAKKFYPQTEKGKWARSTRNDIRYSKNLSGQQTPNFTGRDADYRTREWNDTVKRWGDNEQKRRNNVRDVYNGKDGYRYY